MASDSGKQSSPGVWDTISGRHHTPGSPAEFAEWTNTECWTGEYVERLRETGSSAENTSSDPSSGKSGKKLSRWQRMTPEQRENNKKLQRDYRDRKKAKHEANQAIVSVSDRLKDAQFLKAEGDNLAAANQEIREALTAKEAEVARMRKEVLAKKTTTATYQATQGGGVLARLFRRSNVDKAFAIKCSQFENQVGILRSFLESNGVLPECQGAPQDAAVAATLQRRVKETMAACMHCLGLSAPNLDNLILGASQGITIPSSVKEHYLTIVEQLHLSPSQIQWSCSYLQGLTNKLQRIYEARQKLNQTVLQLMAPTTMSQQTASGGVAPDPGFAVKLGKSLQELQENLGEEQKLESEMHYVNFQTILSPCQGGWLIVLCAPDHCNVRAFLTAVCDRGCPPA